MDCGHAVSRYTRSRRRSLGCRQPCLEWDIAETLIGTGVSLHLKCFQSTHILTIAYMLQVTGRRDTGCKETGRRETGRKETRRKEMGGKTNGSKEMGVGETVAKESGGGDDS